MLKGDKNFPGSKEGHSRYNFQICDINVLNRPISFEWGYQTSQVNNIFKVVFQNLTKRYKKVKGIRV